MKTSNPLHDVLASYPIGYRRDRIEALGNAGGFSGAQFWRIDANHGTYCLRRWPREHPDAKRLKWIHEVLRHVRQHGFRAVPLPYATNESPQCSYVVHEGRLWELTPWIPGAADYQQSPSRTKLIAAVESLAGFHQAARDYHGCPAGHHSSPGITARLQTVANWKQGDLARLQMLLDHSDDSWPALTLAARTIVNSFEQDAAQLNAMLAAAAELRVPLQPCIRDIWDQHVLYDGEKVTGIVDFGAMAVDNVATDIARLLGSLAGDNREDWQAGLAAYNGRRPLHEREHMLIRTFDRSIVLLAGMNWLRWIYLEGRHFPEKAAVLQRVHAILQRLANVTEIE